MARKLPEHASESSLSPPPGDLISPQVKLGIKPEANGQGEKRKAIAKDEDEAKKPPAKKAKQTKKEAVLAPLEERTVDSKLCVGAHVSTAGGKYPPPPTPSNLPPLTSRDTR